MLITTIAVGGTVLGATAIGGFIMLYQLRQSTDLANSAKAVFAADAGIEYGYFASKNPSSTETFSGVLSNGATTEIECYDMNNNPIACNDQLVLYIISVGQFGNSRRAFQKTLP